MNRCSSDDRRACTATDVCPDICAGDSDLQCTNDGQCGGVGPCAPSGPCVAHSDVGSSWYVDTPYTKAAIPNNDLVGQHLANLVRDPVFRVWTEDTVHVTACEVVPAAAYDVVAVDLISSAESTALTIATIGKPLATHYADVVGIVSGGEFTPPQGVVGVTDIQAYLIAFQGGAGSTTPPHTTWVDLHGTEWSEPCTGDFCTIPQAILSVSDLGRIKFGFLGQTYVETPGHENPGDCP